MNQARSLALALVLGGVGLPVLPGCFGDDTAGVVLEGAPGERAYDSDIRCKDDSQCQKGESCTNGVCQMKRCAVDPEGARKPAPLGTSGFVNVDRELVVATTDGIGAYDASGETFARLADARWSSGEVVDLASGNLTGSRPEAFAAATEGASYLTIWQGKNALPQLPIGFVPIAIAAGDTNMDGLDRIVAASSAGSFAVCNVKSATCEKLELGIGNVRDVAVGNVDSDGFAEVLFLAGSDVVVYNYDGGKTTQPQTIKSNTGRTLARIAAGDLDGDGIDEVVGLEAGTSTNIVHSMSFSEGAFSVKGSMNVSRYTTDIAVGGLGNDHISVVAFGEGSTVEVVEGQDDGSLLYSTRTSLPAAARVTHLAFSDTDGNSARATLVGEPTVVAGSMAPLAVLTPPPYSTTYSGEGGGKTRSSVSIGNSASQSTTNDENVTLSYGVGIGFGYGFKGLGFGVGARVGWSLSHSKAITRASSISRSFSFEARPDLNGYQTGAVAVGCGCFTRYDYKIDDPAGTLEDAREGELSIFVPIGGQTSLWSIKRYNQLAEALGNGLPQITVGYKAGDVSSYPRGPQTLAGAPIPANDLLFEAPPSFRVSDVANVNFGLNMDQGASQTVAQGKGYSGSANVGFFLSVNVDAGYSLGSGYNVSVGKSTSFSGSVPPIRDNPNTPEDEFAMHSYSFTPLVYREHYANADKKDASYFVVTYAVGD